MSLIKMSLTETVKKQYRYKLKANIDSISSLIFIQLLAVALSYVGFNEILWGSDHMRIDMKYVSADLVIIFTFIWAFMSAFTITTKPFRHHDFSFISNRLSSSLSNIVFLATMALVGSATALLTGNFLIVTLAFLFDFQLYNLPTVWSETLIAYCVTFLYVLLFISIGYLVGTLFQLHMIVRVLLPFLFIGLLMANFSSSFLSEALHFYIEESALSLLIAKVFGTVAFLFLISTAIWNRLEVRS